MVNSVLLALVLEQLPNWDNPKKEEVQDALEGGLQARAQSDLCMGMVGRQVDSVDLCASDQHRACSWSIGPNRLEISFRGPGTLICWSFSWTRGYCALEMRLCV